MCLQQGQHSERLDGHVEEGRRRQRRRATDSAPFSRKAISPHCCPDSIMCAENRRVGLTSGLVDLDARGRSPNVRSSSQPTVRPRSRGSLPRLPNYWTNGRNHHRVVLERREVPRVSLAGEWLGDGVALFRGEAIGGRGMFHMSSTLHPHSRSSLRLERTSLRYP